jgi:YVTN family beta-propeller protein
MIGAGYLLDVHEPMVSTVTTARGSRYGWRSRHGSPNVRFAGHQAGEAMMMHAKAARVAAIGACLTMVCATVAAADPGRTDAGPDADGTAITPVGFRITPAGRQVRLGDLPLAAALTPDGATLLVSNDGQAVQSLQVVDVRSGAVRQSIEYRSPQALFVGLAVSPDGQHAYASAGGNNKIRVYDLTGGQLTETASIPLPTTNPAGTPVNMYPAGIAVTPDGRRLVIADQLADAATVLDLGTQVAHTIGIGHNPYGVVLSSDGTTAYVTNQGANTVSVLDITGADPAVRATVTVGTHPNKAILDAAHNRVYVTDGDSDEVSVIEGTSVVRTIGLAPYPGAQVGSNPDALALSVDGSTLYVANSGNNDIDLVDVRTGKVSGMVPTAWYPTSVVATGRSLFITNAKGLGAGPNNGPGQPNPTRTDQTPDKYVGSMMVGTLSIVDTPIRQGQLEKYTRQVAENNGFLRTDDDNEPVETSVVPRRPGGATPIQHVIYVVRENRTYDQLMGSLGKGAGDPTINLFGDESAPNARELARRYVTIDNFYADAEISAQGWNWSVAANSNPYSEQTWPANYSNRNHPYPSENGDPAIAPNRDPSNAYIWQRLAARGVSFRNYGFYVGFTGGQYVAQDPVLNANTDHAYTGFNLACPDSPDTRPGASPACGPPRFAEWQREFAQYEQNGNLPTVEFVRLPNDHTAGAAAGIPTPRVYVADNDWALGRLVDTVSHSPYWSSTAIFVTEDDAQNGPDHIDAHRTVSLVVSPYSRTGRIDSTFYSTASMLRTIELLVGLSPMTQFDAYATPMFASFGPHPDLTPYSAIMPTVPFTEVNTAASPLAAQSAQQDLSTEDRIDEQLFNEAIWKSVKGAGSTMPAPVHSLWNPAPSPPNADGDGDGD